MALSGMGETAARSLADEYNVKPYETIEEITKRAKINKSSVEALRVRGVLKGLPETDQLSFFLTGPLPIGVGSPGLFCRRNFVELG